MFDPVDEFPHMAEGALHPLPPLPIASATSLAALAPPEPTLLGPVAPGTITLIRGPRGAGKSWLALAMAHAVASDGALLGWRARHALVLHVEAAMGQAAIAARLRALGPAGPGLAIVCDCPLDLGDATDQARIMDAMPAGGLLVLDGLSLLVPAGRLAAARWRSLCDWLRMLRRDGQAVLLVDHASRPAITALADTLVTIKPSRKDAAVAFTVEIASRQVLPAADHAFAARFDLADGAARWTRAAIPDPALRAVADAAHGGGTVRDIAAALGLSTATTWRRLARARALGLVTDDKAGETGETSGTLAQAAAPEPSAAIETAGSETGHETGETAGAPGRLAKVSTAVLRRTLERRLKAHQRGRAEDGPRAGPAILAGIADAELVTECRRRLKPPHAARLLQEFAPLQPVL